MPSKPMALPTTKKKLRDEADETMRNSILILVEMKDEIGHDPQLALQYWAMLSANVEKTLRLLVEMAQ